MAAWRRGGHPLVRPADAGTHVGPHSCTRVYLHDCIAVARGVCAHRQRESHSCAGARIIGVIDAISFQADILG
jgi:hypothetical protein